MADFACFWECCALVLHFVRTLALLASVFTTLNVNIFVAASIHVGRTSKSSPFAPLGDGADPQPDKHRPKRVPTPPRDTGEDENNPQEPSPRSNPPVIPGNPHPAIPPNIVPTGKQNSAPSYSSILRIHEEIMAADAETIRIQQATIESQQEIIRRQREMMNQLIVLLEMQEG
ncbi:unnamed protein product [Periconia digitata]|uniref:Uncharacterized protein n=1 Tax=Periconia digitata TaxID=1303443 RepID=A0A9W4UIZ8_9PLEO|nr:unnamed protein product [Periconia digitata]